ncbi:MAG TPA: dihydropteroate synthase [Rhizomicrobium sp.]|jgi:dihydropteroate synthase type 2
MTPLLFGIVNITEDSFSDGGRYLSTDRAIAHVHALGDADVLDLGAAASNPEAKQVSPETEIARLTPVVAALKAEGRAVSIDTFSTPVQRWALSQQVGYLNDIQGFADRAFYPELAAASARLVVMHAVQERGPATRIDVPAEQIVERVKAFFSGRIAALAAAGIARERLILDPGMGFFLGTDPETSFAMLRGLADLKATFDLPVLVSVSRKSFLRAATGRTAMEAGPATLAAELFAARQGVDFIRTHDPAPLRDVLRVAERLENPRVAFGIP